MAARHEWPDSTDLGSDKSWARSIVHVIGGVAVLAATGAAFVRMATARPSESHAADFTVVSVVHFLRTTYAQIHAFSDWGMLALTITGLLGPCIVFFRVEHTARTLMGIIAGLYAWALIVEIRVEQDANTYATTKVDVVLATILLFGMFCSACFLLSRLFDRLVPRDGTEQSSIAGDDPAP